MSKSKPIVQDRPGVLECSRIASFSLALLLMSWRQKLSHCQSDYHRSSLNKTSRTVQRHVHHPRSRLRALDRSVASALPDTKVSHLSEKRLQRCTSSGLSGRFEQSQQRYTVRRQSFRQNERNRNGRDRLRCFRQQFRHYSESTGLGTTDALCIFGSSSSDSVVDDQNEFVLGLLHLAKPSTWLSGDGQRSLRS